MADIEPYKQIQKTNIKEHNDLVAKINEIIDVINNTNLDKVIPKITVLENDVSTINATDSLQWTDIESLKDSQSAQDVTIGILDTQVKGVTESLVSDIAIIDGITTGNMKVRVEREKATPIDSNDYNIQKPVSMELIQGSGPSTFKAQITLSDGTIIRSDDFIFTTEAIGTDVYISSFVFKNGNVAGTISADIGLSNGVTIEANNFVVPMDPSLLNTVQDLSTRLSAVEGGSVGGLDELKAQVQTNTSNIGTLTAEIDDLDIRKADSDNPNQTIVAGTITADNITKGGVDVATISQIDTINSTIDNINTELNGKVEIAQGDANAGKFLGINSLGDVVPLSVASGKTLTNETLTNLITNVGGSAINVEKEFEIEYILVKEAGGVQVSSAIVRKGKYNAISNNGIYSIGCAMSFDGSIYPNYIYCNTTLDTISVRIIYSSSNTVLTGSQLTTEDITVSNVTNGYYRLYV